MTAHPHDASDPSSADGPADATRAEVTSGQGYLRRDRPPSRTADDIAALIQDRDDARAAMYRAHDDMWKMREDCDALRAEVGLTFKKLCDAATLAGVREQERDEARAEVGALTTERDTLRQQFVDLRASTLDSMTANWQLEEENGVLKAERARYHDALRAIAHSTLGDCEPDQWDDPDWRRAHAGWEHVRIAREAIGWGKEAKGDT